jgi:hypothetical protein
LHFAINPTWTGLRSNPSLLLLSYSTYNSIEDEEGDEKEKKKTKKNEQ